jgi:acyl-lipid omega-3 desaturase
LVTYLHHFDEKSKFYETKDWSFVKGCETTFDRSYGSIIDHLHHDIGTHVIHHLFFTKIPHYHLKKATDSVKKDLGNFYQKIDENAIVSFYKSVPNCQHIVKFDNHFVFGNVGEDKKF